LDWFHIAKKFHNVRGAVEQTYTETLERVKWTLWQGKPQEALSKLQLLMMKITDSKKRKKLADLSEYLNRNQADLANYQKREQQGQTYTSQVASVSHRIDY
jgi:dTDP-4-amino-4,6-dideoxygalactose transaminase